ncbi:hypothetical protein OIU83_22850 [Flavobacterium sp. LS1R49]|uniref:Uncharacterized protein n=1 Tax=Flavobacterium shii TaxID=2987687 RepID=A0A9X2ZIP3_9FLAO|nr:hypothetical protein [Flavobacterium shii]MCV9930517.1 hypothetical protein [Flavobacterium shii]
MGEETVRILYENLVFKKDLASVKEEMPQISRAYVEEKRIN